MKSSLLTILLLILAQNKLQAGPELNALKAENIQTNDPAVVQMPSKPKQAEWTVMIFMNGKSNIEPFALNDFNRIETIGSSEKINIVAELGRSKGLDNDTDTDGDWTGVRRYLITRDQDKNHIASPLLMDLGDKDMGDYKEAASFMLWAKTLYPAKRYAFIIWDHGWGWIDPAKPNWKPADAEKSISHDFATGNYIRTIELPQIFKEAGKVNLYASMACFMQMAEVAYELRNSADIIVGSEEVVQLPSFNFEDFFRLLTAKPESSAQEAGVYMTDTFKEMYSRPEYSDMLEKTKYGTQLSAIRADKLKIFADKAKRWAELAIKTDERAAYEKAKTDVLRFEVGDETTDPDKQISFYADLATFVALTGANLSNKPSALALKAAGQDLINFITDELVVSNVYLGKDRTGKSFVNARGLAAHIPGKPGTLIEYYETYASLAFDKATGWGKFIAYLQNTQK